MTASSTVQDAGTPWIYDPKIRSIIAQTVVIGIVAGLVYFMAHNTAVNLEKRGIASGFDFLWDPARYDVTGGFYPTTREDTHWDAFMAGLTNTFVVALFGCIASTILGVIMGVLRLSKNWLISKLAAVYVETIRNVPVLLQILFWYGIFILLPTPRNSLSVGESFFLNNRSFLGPKTIFTDGSWLILVAFIGAIVGSIAFARWARKQQEATGAQYPVFLVSLGSIIGLPILATLLMGVPITLEYPALTGFNFTGGTAIDVNFVALWLALVLYTAAFTAEIVRSGILAVSHGQTEAAYAVGLWPSITMRKVILPQALRVIIPPLTSQYLNLTKNSSLAIAVGYPDVVATIGGITLNQTGQAVECIAITMAVYLTFSLLISMGMNWYNQRIALVER